MKINPVFYDDHVILENVKKYNFDIFDTFECGQCFRWAGSEDKYEYTGIAHGKVIHIEQHDDFLKLGCTRQDYLDIWHDYFDLSTDYEEIKEKLSYDDVLYKAIQFAPGIRILRQELFETTISFIISSNSNIKRIKKNIHDLSELTGTHIQDGFYAFPSIAQLAKSEYDTIAQCKAGFRCEYIHESANMISKMSDFDSDTLKKAGYLQSKKYLMQLKGVGHKVADCVILFSGIYPGAFPVDVWVKRVMEDLYIKKDVNLEYVQRYGQEKFHDLAGYAQQYLFYYARNKGIKG